jgi:hypothetical protein
MLSKLKLKLVDYSDLLIGDIDLIAETRLVNEDSKADQINEKRARLIHEIKEIEAFNLGNLSQNDVNELENETDDEKINQVIFKRYCFLLPQQELVCPTLDSVDAMFGLLVVLDKYFTKKKQAFYKEFLQTNKQSSSDQLTKCSFIRYKYKVSLFFL